MVLPSSTFWVAGSQQNSWETLKPVYSSGMTLDLISRARELSEENRRKTQEERDQKLREQKALDNQLKALSSLVLVELEKISGQETKHGVIQLTPNNSRSHIVFSYLEVGAKKMAWFKAYIESGTWDPSDDIRNEPYTVVKIKCRFYPPSPTRNFDDVWDVEEVREKLNGGWELTCTNEQERVTQFFENLAKCLSSWI